MSHGVVPMQVLLNLFSLTVGKSGLLEIYRWSIVSVFLFLFDFKTLELENVTIQPLEIVCGIWLNFNTVENYEEA